MENRITQISKSEDNLEIRCGNDVYHFMDEGQDCCESRYMTCDDDLQSFVGADLLGAEVADAPSVDDHDVQFLRIHTTLGDIVCETHNEHNGYYGGFSVRIRKNGVSVHGRPHQCLESDSPWKI